MHSLAAPIVVLAGAIVFSAGMIAEALKPNAGQAGYVVGGLLLVLGGVGLLKPLWDAIPVDGKKAKSDKTDQSPP